MPAPLLAIVMLLALLLSLVAGLGAWLLWLTITVKEAELKELRLTLETHTTSADLFAEMEEESHGW